ncbi:MAG: general secretion pathway protein G [Verrucomicrobiales bacterium]|jgi:general secretion pathway protein G
MNNYYYCNDGSTVNGPATTDELRDLLADGTLTLSAMICTEGSETWLPISSLNTPVVRPLPPPVPQIVSTERHKPRMCLRHWIIACAIILAVGYFSVVGITALVLTKSTHLQVEQMRAESDIKLLLTQLKLYQARMFQLPTTEEGLSALVTKPESAGDPSRWSQLLDSLPLDAWSRPYQYRSPGKRNPASVEVFSLGPDGLEYTEDDIVGSL